jgi:mono/diheme cytochrome c family protein
MIAGRITERVRNLEPKWSPTAFKATLVAILGAAVAIPFVLAAIPFIEFFNGMAAQPKGKTQMTYGRIFGVDKLVERPPAPGTAAQGYAPYAFQDVDNTIEGAQQAGEQLENPLPVTRDVLEAGRTQYEVYCMACHGNRGEGDGSVVGPNRFPAPPTLHTEAARGYADGTIFHITTKGLGNMPAYDRMLDARERWEAVRYVRVLQRAMNPKPEDYEQ